MLSKRMSFCIVQISKPIAPMALIAKLVISLKMSNGHCLLEVGWGLVLIVCWVLDLARGPNTLIRWVVNVWCGPLALVCWVVLHWLLPWSTSGYIVALRVGNLYFC